MFCTFGKIVFLSNLSFLFFFMLAMIIVTNATGAKLNPYVNLAKFNKKLFSVI